MFKTFSFGLSSREGFCHDFALKVVIEHYKLIDTSYPGQYILKIANTLALEHYEHTHDIFQNYK